MKKRVLTERQIEITVLVSRGLANKEIAACLRISPDTVAYHLRDAFARMKVHSRAALVAEALRLGLLPLKAHPVIGRTHAKLTHGPFNVTLQRL